MKEKNVFLERLSGLEDSSYLCHGDFYFNNIIKDGDDWVVIDWDGAMCSSPIADVAHTAMLLKLGELPRDASLGTRVCATVLRKLFSQLYLHYYFKGQKEKLLEYKEWHFPLSVVCLVLNNALELNKFKNTIEKELKKQG